MVPVPFKVFRPVAEVMNLIKQQNRRSALSPCFGLTPTTLPEARKRCIGLVPRGVDSGIAELRGKVCRPGGAPSEAGSVPAPALRGVRGGDPGTPRSRHTTQTYSNNYSTIFDKCQPVSGA